MPKILPDFVANEDDDSDDEQLRLKITNAKKDKVQGNISCAGSRYTIRRNEIKEMVIREVVGKVLPDMGAYNMDDIIFGKKEKKIHWFYRLLMDIGILSISCQEAILAGSYKKLSNNLIRNDMKIDPELHLSDSKDVSFHLFYIIF